MALASDPTEVRLDSAKCPLVDRAHPRNVSPALRHRLDVVNGHTFPHSPSALAELQHETARLRLGRGSHSAGQPPQYESTELYDGHEPAARASWSDDE